MSSKPRNVALDQIMRVSTIGTNYAIAVGGMALLGVQEMKIPAPLRCGDTVRVKVKVLAKRETSKPDRGVVTSEHQVINQKGDVLLEYTVNRMIRCRPAA